METIKEKKKNTRGTKSTKVVVSPLLEKEKGEMEVLDIVEQKEKQEWEEKVVRKGFYDFVPWAACRLLALFAVQLLRLGLTLILILLVTDSFSLLRGMDGGHSSCSPKEEDVLSWELMAMPFRADIYGIRLLGFLFLLLAFLLSLGVDLHVMEKANRFLLPEERPLIQLSIEGIVFNSCVVMHLVAYWLLSTSLFECSGPYVLFLKKLSLMYWSIFLITLMRLPVRFVCNHRSYFLLTKKIRVEKKKE